MNATTPISGARLQQTSILASELGDMALQKEHAHALNCPHCHESIDISSALYEQIEQQVHSRLEQRFVQQRTELDAERSQLSAAAIDLQTSKADLEEARAQHAEEREHNEERIHEAVINRTNSMRKALEKEIQADHRTEITAMRTELEASSLKVFSLHKVQAENERLKRIHLELEAKLEARFEKRHSEQMTEERLRIRKAEEQRAKLAVTEKEEVIRQLNTQLQDAQRRAQQGSMQLQGEAQEIMIESWLTSAFSEDTIEGINKGARGADTLQTVHSERVKVGSIYYESKRTKSFSERWLAKFRQDMQARGVDFGVLVTQTMPKNMPRMGLRDGIWICSFDEFKGLAVALRECLLLLVRSRTAAASCADRHEMLFKYVSGNEFRLLVENLVDGFLTMRSDLETEKRSIQAAWKRRETQLDRALLNTTHLHATIRGIGGTAVAPVAQLELSEV